MDKEKKTEQKTEQMSTLFSAVFAEFVATGFLVLIACGSAMSTANYILPGTVAIGIALAFGLTVFTLATTIGHISGGHLNPALTFAFMLAGKIPVIRGILYMMAQFGGGLLGAGFLVALMPSDNKGSCFAANVVASNLTVGQAFVWEILLAFFLLFVVGAAADTFKANTTMVPLAIGMAVAVCHFVAIPLDGCGINPARSLASAVAATSMSGCEYVWEHHWIFWVGPFIGAPLGLTTYILTSSVALGPHVDKAQQNLTRMYRRKVSLTPDADCANTTRVAPMTNETEMEEPQEKPVSPRPTPNLGSRRDVNKASSFRN